MRKGRTEASGLVMGRLQAKVDQQAGRIAYLERKLEDLKAIIAEMCECHEIPRPDLRFRHHVPLRVTQRHFAEDTVCEDDEAEHRNEDLTAKLLGEMVINQGKKFDGAVSNRNRCMQQYFCVVLPHTKHWRWCSRSHSQGH